MRRSRALRVAAERSKQEALTLWREAGRPVLLPERVRLLHARAEALQEGADACEELERQLTKLAVEAKAACRPEEIERLSRLLEAFVEGDDGMPVSRRYATYLASGSTEPYPLWLRPYTHRWATEVLGFRGEDAVRRAFVTKDAQRRFDDWLEEVTRGAG